ncbi:hypothetical protein BC833DRAFT_613305 [Globomyces pollinis-pini]|nr:hypothetical protein BC833DRAFT_613305 [Globomyces pollinis-pini]
MLVVVMGNSSSIQRYRFQYVLNLTDTINDDDFVFKNQSATVVTDQITLDMMKGSKVDYLEELIGSSFQIVDNPNAESSCGCKISFNIK